MTMIYLLALPIFRERAQTETSKVA
jgi:hypothetical protein